MDSDHLRAAKAGDSGAGGLVFAWVSRELRGFFRARGVRDDVVADLVQQTSTEMLKNFAEAPTEPDRFGRWMRGYGRNIHRRWLRKVGRYGEILAGYEDQPRSLATRSLESEVREQQVRERVIAAIDDLSSPRRSTLRLFIDGHDVAEIAAELRVAKGTVRWRLMRARDALRGRQDLEELLRSPEQGSGPTEAAS